jgi:hypothetical protein
MVTAGRLETGMLQFPIEEMEMGRSF